MISPCYLRRSFLVFSLIFLTIIQINAQLWRMRRVELTFGAGTTYFFSDIGGYKSIELKDFYGNQTKINFNMNGKYRIASNVTGRLSFAYGKLGANDATGTNVSRDYTSLVSFFETALMGEYYLLRNSSEKSFFYPMRNEKTIKKIKRVLDLYVFAGIGTIKYNISSNEKFAAVINKPDGWAMVFPAGAGTAVVLSPDFSLGIELGGRFAFSDKIDGFTSSFSRSNDIYYFLNIFLTFRKRSSSSMINYRR